KTRRSVSGKETLCRQPCLAYYDPKKPISIQCDASSTGLGAVFLQDNHPIHYASRSLTPTEQKYGQIEREMLAVVFSLLRFHQYIYGRHVTVVNDHKPLESILSKPLDTAPKRLQRMII